MSTNAVSIRSLPSNLQGVALEAKNWVGNQPDAAGAGVITPAQVTKYFHDKFDTEMSADGSLHLSSRGVAAAASDASDEGREVQDLYNVVALGEAPAKPQKAGHRWTDGITFPWDNLDDGGGGFHIDFGFHD